MRLRALLASCLILTIASFAPFSQDKKASASTDSSPESYSFDEVDKKYYLFVPYGNYPDSFWDEALNGASALSYMGAQGHLATPMNQREQDAIDQAIGGNYEWLDALLGGKFSNNQWAWEDGPNAGTVFTACEDKSDYWWSEYQCNSRIGYTNWSGSSSFGNDSDALMVTRGGKWRPLYYSPDGYVVEFDLHDFYNLRSTNTPSGVTLSWDSLSSDPLATVQKSSDGVFWSTIGTTISSNFAIKGVATSYYVRVLASNSNPSNVILITTGGLAPQVVKFKTDDGRPIVGGAVSWSLASGTARSSQSYGLLSDGSYAFQSAPAGVVNLKLVNGVLPDGALVSGTFQGILSAGTIATVEVAAPQARHRISVLTPDGAPVWGARVSVSWIRTTITDSSNVKFSIPYELHPCTSWEANDYEGCSVSNLTTGIDGTVSFWGYYEQTSVVQSKVQVIYDDGFITQSPEAFVPDMIDSQITLDYAPTVLNVSSQIVASGPNVLTPVTISLTTSASANPHIRQAHATTFYSGKRVTAIPPSGYKACAGQVLAGTSDAKGRVVFKICSTATGQIRFKTPGIVIPGAVTMLINRTVSLPVRSLSLRSLSRGSLAASWLAPTFTGGSPITSYQVTLTAPGKPTLILSTTKTQVVATGLRSATTYAITVRPISKLGAGQLLRTSAPVA